MQVLGMECHRLEIHLHVSTAYVNCEKQGFIEEKIYDIEEDSEEVINAIMKMTPE